MNKIRLIVIEGHDRCGKDTILDSLDFKEFLVYRPLSADKEHVDYKNPEVFEKWLREHIRKVLDDLYTMSKMNSTDRPIVLTRLVLTDNVFADLFNRNHVLEKYFNKEIESNFNVTNYIMLWRNYDEYLKRLEMIEEKPDFTKEDLDKTRELFFKYKNSGDIIKFVDATDTKEDVLDDFISTFIEETPNSLFI